MKQQTMSKLLPTNTQQNTHQNTPEPYHDTVSINFQLVVFNC